MTLRLPEGGHGDPPHSLRNLSNPMRGLTIAALILIVGCGATSSQERVNPQWTNEAQLGQPIFQMQTYRRLDSPPDSVRLDIAVEVMNDVLQFVHFDSLYQAEIEL
ncbi:MAG: hypothetical protein V2A61_06825, partial [Calditrichota bacterium]